MICTWDNPGVDKYVGTAAEAISHYAIPAQDQANLVYDIHRINPAAVITITRDGIVAGLGIASDLRDMHYGKDKVCSGPVTRDKWTDDRKETALVYCSGIYCVAIPSVCHNVALIHYRAYTVAKKLPERTYVVPEPSSLALVLVGMAILFKLKRSNRG